MPIKHLCLYAYMGINAYIGMNAYTFMPIWAFILSLAAAFREIRVLIILIRTPSRPLPYRQI